MRSKVLTVLLCSLAFLLNGCANLGVSAPDNQHLYSIQVAEPNRVRFSGRGAGAGIMLSGTMGAMGIALGLAIDEGIGKDIGETAEEAELYFPELLKKVVADQSGLPIDWVDESEVSDRTFVIQRYGFVTAPGGDEVYPHFVIQVMDAHGAEKTATVPDDFIDTPEKLSRATFDAIKTDATEIGRLWRDGLTLIFENENVFTNDR